MINKHSANVDDRRSDSGIHLLDFGEQQFRHVFEETTIPIGVCDGEGNFLFFNSAYVELVGYTLKELYRTNFEAIVHPADLDKNRELIEELTQGDRTSIEVVNRYVHKEGHALWVHKYVSVLRDEAGQVTHMIGIVTDVNESKQIELSLQENQERLKAILNSATDAIISIDRDGIIEGVNPATEKVFGYSEGELLGQKIGILMPPPYCDEHDDYIAHYLQTGEKRIIGTSREFIARRKDGTRFPIELTVAEVNHLEIFTGFVRDISEQKQEHERVLKAERLAGLGEAMAALVHENRNALARVQANLRMLSRRLGNDPELLKLIDGALTASDDLGRQYEEVREYAAPIRLKCGPCKLNDLVEEAWEQLSTVRTGRKTTLRLTYSDTESDCEADRFQLLNAFRNILENALTAAEDNEVLVDVEFLAVKLDGNSAVQIVFRDYGPGLDPQVAEHALDAFVTTKTRGTGLGLAIVKRIVEAHAGIIAIAPAEGNGTTVSVTLPAMKRKNC